MKHVFNDGGRSRYFAATNVCDCVTRAVAIATGRDYMDVYTTARKLLKYSPRDGVKKRDTRKIMSYFGGVWHATMQVGAGCRVHLRSDELPKGRIVCNLSGHVCAVIDGVINDTYDPSRNGTRCVYGYWTFN